MGGQSWTDEEKAIAIYFAYRGVPGEAISQLLNVRGFTRSKSAVWGRLRGIESDNNVSIRSLTTAEADSFIDQVARGYDIIGLLSPTDEDQRIVSKYRPDIDVWKEYEEWLDRVARAQ
ncbi:hypothetical protein BJX96DRAFT_179535 [Aspergillus floccosus]